MTRYELNSLLENSIPLPSMSPDCVLDKPRSIRNYVAYMLDRTNSMFEYDNLPDTIPAYILELYLQIFGGCAFGYIPQSSTTGLDRPKYSTPSGHYVLYGSLGGERDIYYRPTRFIVGNPRLKNSIDWTVVYDQNHEQVSNPCVFIKNDTNYMGLLPLFERYAAQLTENDISIRSGQINARAQIGICVSTDRDKETARKYLDNLEAGKLGVLAETSFLEGVTVANVSTQASNHIIQLIELQQYLKASWFNELGLNVNFNMKREYMSEEEIAVNTDILLPLVDDMYRNRQEAVDLINSTFGLDIVVRKSSAWANKDQEDMAALSEASLAGGIPLNDSLDAKMNSDYSGSTGMPQENPNEATLQAGAQTPVQPGEDQSGSTGTEPGQQSQPELGPTGGTEPLVVINIDTQTTKVDVEGGDADVEPASQEPEKSDSE